MKKVIQTGQSYPRVIKKSKFIASISPVKNERDAKLFINKIKKKHKKATHNCFAYRIYINGGIVINESDDGEPSGTAGQSILYVLEMQDIVNTAVVVTRYFGGIKLGKGGLVRNYSTSTSELIKAIGLETF